MKMIEIATFVEELNNINKLFGVLNQNNRFIHIFSKSKALSC